jgi:hypothetical protein
MAMGRIVGEMFTVIEDDTEVLGSGKKVPKMG